MTGLKRRSGLYGVPTITKTRDDFATTKRKWQNMECGRKYECGESYYHTTRMRRMYSHRLFNMTGSKRRSGLYGAPTIASNHYDFTPAKQKRQGVESGGRYKCSVTSYHTHTQLYAELKVQSTNILFLQSFTTVNKSGTIQTEQNKPSKSALKDEGVHLIPSSSDIIVGSTDESININDTTTTTNTNINTNTNSKSNDKDDENTNTRVITTSECQPLNRHQITTISEDHQEIVTVLHQHLPDNSSRFVASSSSSLSRTSAPPKSILRTRRYGI